MRARGRSGRAGRVEFVKRLRVGEGRAGSSVGGNPPGRSPWMEHTAVGTDQGNEVCPRGIDRRIRVPVVFPGTETSQQERFESGLPRARRWDSQEFMTFERDEK